MKLLPQEDEVSVLAESGVRAGKERGRRRRKLKARWQRLGQIRQQDLARNQRLEKLGGTRNRAGRAAAGRVKADLDTEGKLAFSLDRARLRTVRHREGRYLLRTNLSADHPELLRRCYLQLEFVEEAFRTLKCDLGLRPIYHHKPERIEAHLFLAFLAYCLSITLRQRLKARAGGLMPRVVFEKLATLQLLDVRVPTTDGRELLLVRRTEPDREVALLLARLNWEPPPQPPPRSGTAKPNCPRRCSGDLCPRPRQNPSAITAPQSVCRSSSGSRVSSAANQTLLAAKGFTTGSIQRIRCNSKSG